MTILRKLIQMSLIPLRVIARSAPLAFRPRAIEKHRATKQSFRRIKIACLAGRRASLPLVARNDTKLNAFVLIDLIQRPIFLYLILAAICFRFIDRDKAMVNYLNNFSSLEAYLSALADDSAEFDRIRLIEGTHYYKILSSYFPTEAIWQGNLGFCYFHLGRYDEAYNAFTRAIAIEPENYSYHFDQGSALLKLKKPYAAMTSYYRSIKLADFVEQTYAESIRILLEKKNHDEVHKIYEVVVTERKDRKYLVKYLATLGAYLKREGIMDAADMSSDEFTTDVDFEKVLRGIQFPVYVHYRHYSKK